MLGDVMNCSGGSDYSLMLLYISMEQIILSLYPACPNVQILL